MLTAGNANSGRKQGACLECRRAKRKCDQLTPQCSQCQKKDQACSLQVFKVQTIASSQGSQRRLAASVLEEVGIDHGSPQPLTTDSVDNLEASSRVCVLWKRSSECHVDTFPSPLSDLHATLTANSIDSPTRPLQSAARRLLWDYFVSKASGVFLCWEPDDNQLDKKYTDPYSDSIPAVAIRSRPMMLASLALSAFHVAGGSGRSHEDESLITLLMLEASSALATTSLGHRQQGQQQRSSDAFNDLVAAVGTASFLYLINPSGYADMLPLSRSAALCLTTEPRWQNTREPAHQAIMQIFRWLDICAQCSLKRHVPVLDEHTQLRLEVQENERTSSLSPSYIGWVVHPLYAFAEVLITPLRRVAWLIRLRQERHVYELTGNSDGTENVEDDGQYNIISNGASRESFHVSPRRFEVLVDETERMIALARDKVCDASGPDLRTDLSSLATSIESAIVILFQTRLKDVPWTSPVVRTHVRNIVTSLAGIAPETRFANGVVFPLFVAGLEAVDVADRGVIVDKIKHLPGLFSRRETQLLGCLEHVWALRDANPGAVWNSWIHEVSSDYEDCIPA